MKVSALTECGPHREANEDAVKFGCLEDDCCYGIVCDGMGGASGGQLASSMCVEKASSAIENGFRSKMTVKAVKNLLESAIIAANSQIFTKATNTYGLRGMGTTIVAAIVLENIAIIAHVGDSRAYLFSNGSISQITKDHSLVQVMIDNGKITPEEAAVHPDRNIITRAVGVSNFIDVEFDYVDITNGDKLLLCSDGLSGALNENDLKILLNTNSSVDILVKKAIDNGSSDNVTALLIQGE